MSTAAVKSEFSTQYQHLCDDELLVVAAQRATLTPDACLALEAEMAARHLTQSDLDAYVAAAEQQETERAEFAGRFARCSLAQLRHIVAEPLTLTPEMRSALIEEFQRRQIPLPPELDTGETAATPSGNSAV